MRPSVTIVFEITATGARESAFISAKSKTISLNIVPSLLRRYIWMWRKGTERQKKSESFPLFRWPYPQFRCAVKGGGRLPRIYRSALQIALISKYSWQALVCGMRFIPRCLAVKLVYLSWLAAASRKVLWSQRGIAFIVTHKAIIFCKLDQLIILCSGQKLAYIKTLQEILIAITFQYSSTDCRAYCITLNVRPVQT